MKLVKQAFAILSLASAAIAADAPAKPEVKIVGDIELQGRRDMWDNKTTNNLDQFFGRINFGASMQGEGVSGKINIRAFPEGFGYEVLTGATFDTTGQGALKASKTGIANFQVESAWMKYDYPMVSLKVGRYFTTTSKTLHFGNFLNQNSGGLFMTKIAYHNAMEFINVSGPVSSSVMFTAGDKNLNTGSLRVFEALKLSDLNMGAGWYANVFDTWQNEDAVVVHRLSVNADYTISKGLMPYAEVGVLQNTVEDSWDVPLLVGITIPTDGWLNLLALELEYSDETAREDYPMAINVQIDKTLSPHSRIRAGISNSRGEEEFGRFTAGLRFIGTM